jgi:hypothetical protein
MTNFGPGKIGGSFTNEKIETATLNFDASAGTLTVLLSLFYISSDMEVLE